jgi:uncharacterized protein YqgV (UPF0045/DUF77 family)
MTAMKASTMMMVSLGVSAATAGMSYMAQQANMKAQVEAQETNLQAQRDAATTAMVQSTEDLQQRELQERASTALKLDNARRKADEAQATANATSESAGLSMEALMNDYDRQYGSYADAQMQQLGFNTDQIGRQREQIEAQAKGRINSMPRSPVQGGSLGGAILGFAADAAGAYQKFSVRDPLTGEYTLN